MMVTLTLIELSYNGKQTQTKITIKEKLTRKEDGMVEELASFLENRSFSVISRRTRLTVLNL